MHPPTPAATAGGAYHSNRLDELYRTVCVTSVCDVVCGGRGRKRAVPALRLTSELFCSAHGGPAGQWAISFERGKEGLSNGSTYALVGSVLGKLVEKCRNCQNGQQQVGVK